MNEKFTPGPWRAVDNGHYFEVLIKSDVFYSPSVADVYPSKWLPGGDNSEANANLIAAAPDMYEVLANIENDDGRIPSTIWEMRNAALAKARGEA